MLMKRPKDISAKEVYKRIKVANGHESEDPPPSKMTKKAGNKDDSISSVEMDKKRKKAEKRKEKQKEKRREKRKEKRKQMKEKKKANGNATKTDTTADNKKKNKKKKKKKNSKKESGKAESSKLTKEEEKNLLNQKKVLEKSLESEDEEEFEDEVEDEMEEDEDYLEGEDFLEEDDDVECEEEEDLEDEDFDEEDEELGEEDSLASLEAIDPVLESEALLESLMGPVNVAEFFKHYWEKKPLVVKRKCPSFYSDWLTTTEIDEMLRENRVMFTEHLDVTSYVNGERETHNPEGRAFPAVVWDFYRSGCSVRMLCPQAFSETLAFKLNLLQEYFGCFVGANAYLTPPGTQGFAPHYDDIEAFVLQLEGQKTWRLHNPRNINEKLARFSSRNFTQEEVGPSILEVTLSAGDMLYFPRGMIHQAMSTDEEHSLHLTISTNQKNTWGDMLSKLLPLAVETAMAQDVRFRAGLPPGYLRYMGDAVAKHNTKDQRAKFCTQAKQLLQELVTKYVSLDAACDEMGKQLVHDSLPPVLADGESLLHVSQQGEQWCSEYGEVINAAEVSPDTELRLVRGSCVRLVTGEDGQESRLYHSLTNTKFYHEVEPTFSVVSQEALPCVKTLLKAYPGFVRVEDFPLAELDEKINVAASLYDMGLVISREPLAPCEEAASEEDVE